MRLDKIVKIELGYTLIRNSLDTGGNARIIGIKQLAKDAVRGVP